jgi:LacI family transcriptional regulator
MTMPITISDVAFAVGKSGPTVSRALNNHPKISSKTKLEIQAAATRLGYFPSFTGASLKSGCTNIFSIIVPQITNPFYAKLINHVKHLAIPRNYDVVAYDFDLNPKLERQCLNRMLGRCCDGVITSLSSFEHTHDLFNKMWQAQIPCVIVGSPPDTGYQVNYDAVNVDCQQAWDKLLKLLYHGGHRDIVFAFGALPDEIFSRVSTEVKTSFVSAGLPFDPKRNIHRSTHSTGSYPNDGVNSGRAIFRDHPNVTAIIAINDFLAYGIMHAAAECHKRIPADLVLVGRDKTWISEYAPSPLPTIDQRVDLIAAKAMEIIFDRVTHPNWDTPKKFTIKGELYNADSL